MSLRVATKEEFEAFVAAKPYRMRTVQAGAAIIDVYYDEPTYNPSLRDACKVVHPGGVEYQVKDE